MQNGIYPSADPYLRLAIDAAKRALGVTFVVAGAPGPQRVSQHSNGRSTKQMFGPPEAGVTTFSEGRAVRSVITSSENLATVVFEFPGLVRPELRIAGKLERCPAKWLAQLVASSRELIASEIERYEQQTSLDELASQISRDFEELVWTRDLARHIQQTDIRAPLPELAHQILPTLLETIQCSQIALILHPATSELDWNVSSAAANLMFVAGERDLTQKQMLKVVARYQERAAVTPVVNNRTSQTDISQLQSFILVPVESQADMVGWLFAINRKDTTLLEAVLGAADSLESQPEFGTFEAGLMQSAASFLASHSKNTSLYAEQEDLLVGVVRALVNAIDAKDRYTCGHSDRVALMSRTLSRALGLSEDQCEEMYLSGLLHDIGKIGIPDSVLLKTATLTSEDHAIIQQHPIIGYQLLQHVRQISYVLPGVLHHHESMNGSGYPHHLVGDAIPLAGRIIAVVDAFDAMTSNRPYRKRMSFEQAESILQDNRGPQWDPEIVTTFLEHRDEFRDICLGHVSEPLGGWTEDTPGPISRAVGVTHGRS